MKRYKVFKTRNYIKTINILWIVIFLITINTFLLFNYFNKSINPKMIKIVEVNINKMLNNIITEYSLKEDYKTIEKILIINKNKDEEIINIDFDLPSVYNFSAHITDELKADLYNLEVGKTNMDFYDDYLSNNQNYFVLKVPIGIYSNNIYSSNLGPRIPVKVKFIGSILTGVKTKVTSYGINNSLIEVYTNISISSLILTPVKSKIDTRNFEVLIASKIINGKVPSLYNGTMEASSRVLNTSLE